MWADTFVGIPYKKMGRDRNGVDCYGLVRLVLKKIVGQNWPSYCEEDPEGSTITQLASNLKHIKIEEARELDVAIILMSHLNNAKVWEMRPTHMGIFVDGKRILHIDEGRLSRVQMAKEINIHSILRVT